MSCSRSGKRIIRNITQSFASENCNFYSFAVAAVIVIVVVVVDDAVAVVAVDIDIVVVTKASLKC